MIRYDIHFINNIINDISNNKLSADVENYLNTILDDIKKPIYNISPNFNNSSNSSSSYKSTRYKNQKNYKNYRGNKYKDINNKDNNNDNNSNNISNRMNRAYSFNNFNELKSLNKNNNQLNQDIKNNDDKLINTIKETNGLSETNGIKETNGTNENNHLNENNLNNMVNIINSNFNINSNYKLNRIKDINNKSEYELAITNIRKILNKLTSQTYKKLKNEFLCYYSSLYNQTNKFDNLNDFNNINNFIFDSFAYNNKLFSTLYCDLLYNLININDDFSIILNNNLQTYIEIYKNIHVPHNLDYDIISQVNKHNDKYKCFCFFYINCFKLNLVPLDLIFKSIYNLQKELLDNIKIDNKKYYSEELSEFIYLIISNIYIYLRKDKSYNKEYNDLYDKIKYISNLKNNSFISISNKIIFKHMDILDKYPQLNP